MLARAIVIPRGVSRRTALATTSRSLPEGRLSAGKIESKDAIPAVTFYSRHQHIAFSNILGNIDECPYHVSNFDNDRFFGVL